MKEYPEPNYLLEIANLPMQHEPGVRGFLSGGWVLSINHITTVTYTSYLPTVPWPPPAASDLDLALDRDEAARIVLSTSAQLVTPTNGTERIEELFGDLSQRQTIFWVTMDHYTALDIELRELSQRPMNAGHSLRLSDLGDSLLWHFLTSDLPRSGALTQYEREILCLPRLP